MADNLVAVYGASGYGREVMPLVKKQFSTFSGVKFYFVDDGSPPEMINGSEVVSYAKFLALAGKKYITIAIADSSVRKILQKKCLSDSIEIISILSENCIVMDDVKIEAGSILSPFVSLTSNIQIGEGFHANIYSYVAHDCVIGNYVTFAPGVKCNGNVIVEDGVYIGTGAIIKQGKPDRPLVIGKGAVIGMGAVVTKNVAENDVVFGVPAKSIKRRK